MRRDVCQCEGFAEREEQRALVGRRQVCCLECSLIVFWKIGVGLEGVRRSAGNRDRKARNALANQSQVRRSGTSRDLLTIRPVLSPRANRTVAKAPSPRMRPVAHRSVAPAITGPSKVSLWAAGTAVLAAMA